MELENRVCGFELSKILKGLGYLQNSLCCWVDSRTERDPEVVLSKNLIYTIKKKWKMTMEQYSKKFKDLVFIYSAPAVAELGEALPYRLRLEDDDYWLQIFKEDDFWEIRYFGYKEGIPLRVGHKEFSFQNANEANTRGLMWEFLKKNNFLEEGR